MYFNPPAPCGAGPVFLQCFGYLRIFQSTRPLRGGTGENHVDYRDVYISIHPPLAGRDVSNGRKIAAFDISIHPPLAGRDRDFIVYD